MQILKLFQCFSQSPTTTHATNNAFVLFQFCFSYNHGITRLSI